MIFNLLGLVYNPIQSEVIHDETSTIVDNISIPKSGKKALESTTWR